jgi:hypothetical protein
MLSATEATRTAEEREATAINELARQLHHKMWHLEPSHVDPNEDWAGMDEEERDFYRILVRDLLQGLRPYGLRRPLTTIRANIESRIQTHADNQKIFHPI